MDLSRREVLAATGVAGAGTLGIGYWQRRRLARFSTIMDFRYITGIAVPEIEDDSVITRSLLEPAYDRAITRFDEIESRLDPPFDRYSEEFVADLRERLTDRAPGQVTVWPHGPPAIHYARRQALFTYRRTRSRLVSILAHESSSELPPETFEERSAAVRDRIESLAVPYRGTSLGEAIVAGTTIESAIDSAESRLDSASEEDEYRTQWRDLERATAALEDAESFVRARQGSDYGDDLPAVAERLRNEFERRREEAPDSLVEDDNEDPVSSFAIAAISVLHRSMRRLGAYPYGRGGLLDDDDRYGRAAYTYALLLPTVSLYEAFADVPHAPFWEEREYRVGASTEDLRAEKTATIDAIEPYLDADDPLVTNLAAVPLGAVRDTDGRLETMIGDVRTLTDDEWAMRRDEALLRYESAHRYAEAIDETIGIVTEM